jgi:hypothetical protein
MAGFMDYFTGGGNAGAGFDMFGANASGMNDLLTAQQQEAIKRQSMMAMAAQLLQAGGRSPQRTSLGQALGQGLMAGQQAQQAGTTGAVNQMLLRGKLDEAKRAQAQREQMSRMLLGGGGAAGEGMDAATQAINAPVAAAGPMGPTVQRAAMIPQIAQNAAGGAPVGSPFAGLSQTQRALMAGLPADQQGKAMMDYLSGSQEFGAPMTFMRGGQPVMAQQNKFGIERVMTGATPYNALPTDIQAVEYVTGKPIGGTGNVGAAALKAYREQIAPKTTITNQLPAGPNQFVQAGGTAAMGRLGAATDAASSANDTLRNIDMIAPALDQAVLGPGADYRTTMTRIGSQLGIAGPNAEATLQNTRQVVQGLAQAELTAAGAMKGQGQITENERALLKRTAAGDQSMTAAELRTGMAAMQKLAMQRQQEQAAMLQTARGVQGFAPIAPMFEVQPYAPQFNLGSNINLGNALNKAIEGKK